MYFQYPHVRVNSQEKEIQKHYITKHNSDSDIGIEALDDHNERKDITITDTDLSYKFIFIHRWSEKKFNLKVYV